MSQLTRAEQKSETRTRILRAATLVCGRDGFVRTKTADVAREAGLSHGALFVHFPTRVAMLEEVVGGMVREIAGRLHGPPRRTAGLRRCLDAQVASIAEHEGLYRHFLLEWTLLEFDARAMWAGMEEAMAAPFAEAMAHEDVRKGSRPLLFATWMGLLHYMLMHEGDGPVLAQRSGELVEHFLSLVRKGKKK